MAMQMSGHERRVAELVSPQLAPGEQLTAIAGRVQTGPSPWFSLITYLIFFLIKYYALALTDQRLFLVRLSFWTGRPKSVEAVYPRQSVRLLEYKAPTLWGVMRLGTPAGEMKLNVPRLARGGADAVAAALGAWSASPGPAGYSSAPPPPPPPTA